MADALFRAVFGEDAKVSDPRSLVCFRDHLTLLGQALTPRHSGPHLYDHRSRAPPRARTLREATWRQALRRVESESGPRSYVNLHNVVVDELGMPGSVIVGTDSHTCTAGALGAFAFGVGSTDMANAFFTRDVRVRVPESVRVVLSGALRPGTSAKDVMLTLLGTAAVQKGELSGKVLEFCGSGVTGFRSTNERRSPTWPWKPRRSHGIVAFDERAHAALPSAEDIPYP